MCNQSLAEHDSQFGTSEGLSRLNRDKAARPMFVLIFTYAACPNRSAHTPVGELVSSVAVSPITLHISWTEGVPGEVRSDYSDLSASARLQE